jgi:hypothetical protein
MSEGCDDCYRQAEEYKRLKRELLNFQKAAVIHTGKKAAERQVRCTPRHSVWSAWNVTEARL